MNIIKRFFFLLLSIGGAVACIGCNISSSSSSGGNASGLATPSNLKLNETNWRFFWDKVEEAESYDFEVTFYEPDHKISYVFKTEDNYYDLIPSADKMSFRVRSEDTDYGSKSNWSEPLDYEMKYDQISKANILNFAQHIKVNRINLLCVDLLGIDYYEKTYSGASEPFTTYNINIYAVFYTEEEGQPVYTLLDMLAGYKTPVTSLEEYILSRKYPEVRSDQRENRLTLGEYKARDYDSMKYYLQSDSYKTALQEYRDAGYVFESPKYKVGIKEHTLNVLGMFKLTKGDDVKYFAYGLNFYIGAIGTDNEQVECTLRMKNFSSDYTRVVHFNEVSGEYVEIATLFFD